MTFPIQIRPTDAVREMLELTQKTCAIWIVMMDQWHIWLIHLEIIL